MVELQAIKQQAELVVKAVKVRSHVVNHKAKLDQIVVHNKDQRFTPNQCSTNNKRNQLNPAPQLSPPHLKTQATLSNKMLNKM